MMTNKNLYFILFYSFLIFVFVNGSCSKDLGQSTSNTELAVYPPPPDTTRVQYLTSISISSDIKGKQSAFRKFMFGEEVPKPVIKPYGIMQKDSMVYICDTGIEGLIMIDLSNKSFDYFVPTGRGQLQLPLNCYVDEIGDLFVADANRRQIVVFDSKGKYKSEFGETGESFKPTDVFVLKDTVYVTSVKDQRLFVYEKNSHRRLFSFPDAEEGEEGYLYQPTSMFADDNFLYISDMGDSKVKVFTHSGSYVRSVGGYGTYIGQLTRPKGIAVDKKGNLFVVDAAFENVQIFNNTGKVLMSFGGPYMSHGDMWLPADVTISYEGLQYFSNYVDESFKLKYLIYVTNQYGPDKVSVYGFVEPR
jgi:DNA-binding beta-propeller fold protein YncE